MARIRSLHPGQATDEAFVQCSPFARLLALLIRCEADDGGIFEWKPLQIKMRVFPADNVDVAGLLTELVETNQVARYESGGKAYGIIRNFRKFQSPRRPSCTFPWPKAGDVPPEFMLDDVIDRSGRALDGSNDDNAPGSDDAVPDNVGNQHPSEINIPVAVGKVLPDGVGEESSRRKVSNPPLRVPPLPEADRLFDRFWKAYPSRGEASNPKKPAKERFDKLVERGTDAEAIIAGVERYARRCRAQRILGTATVAQALTFLNQERWQDDEPGPVPVRDAIEQEYGKAWM